MYSFKDKNGEEWDLTMTLGAAERIDSADLTKFYKEPHSILDMQDKSFLGTLLSDIRLMFAVIWCVISPEYHKRHPELNNDDEAAQQKFADAVDRRTTVDGREAFIASLSDFSQGETTAFSLLIEGDRKIREIAAIEVETLRPELMVQLEQTTRQRLADLKVQLTTELQSAAINGE